MLIRRYINYIFSIEYCTCFGRHFSLTGLRQSFLKLRIDQGIRIDDAKEYTVDHEAADHDHPGPKAAIGWLNNHSRRFARKILVGLFSHHVPMFCVHRVLCFVHSFRLSDRRIDRQCHASG